MVMEKPQALILLGAMFLQYSCFFQLSISFSSNFTDQSALLAIQSKISIGPNNTILGGNWTMKTSFCTWIGVSCSKHRQRVTSLDLSFMGLQGTISPFIGNLSFLVSLDLENNSFTGFLPHEISHLHRLRILRVHFNHLEGNIPKDLGFLPRLQKLYIGYNDLMGGIPSSLGNISTLQEMSLRQSGLEGLFPPALFNLSSLVTFSVFNNNISGTLPVNLCHFWPNIELLSLSSNKFTGPIPSGIDQCKEIQKLSLSYNMLYGSIPEEFGSLQNLEVLYLGENSLTGTIPSMIGNLTNLEDFDLVSNNITGTIPRELGHLSKLRVLTLGDNSLTGAIPQELFNVTSLQDLEVEDNVLSGAFPSHSGVMLPNLEILYCRSNQITGDIPSYFSNFTKLIALDVSENSLYGPMPANLGSLKHLQFLNLGLNRLTGEPGVHELRFLSSLFNSSSLENVILEGNPLNGIIPDSFGNFSNSFQIIYAPDCEIKGHIPKTLHSLKNLNFLDLSGNHMSGNIPPLIGGLEMLQRLYLENNNIEGFIPEELCLLKNLGELSLANNTISGFIPNCTGSLSNLRKVLLDSNRFTSSIPVNLWNLENLLFLNLSFNSFSGDLPPRMTKLNVLQMIDLSWNKITGSIPSIMGSFQTLNALNLSNNLLTGSVPKSFGDMKGLEVLDLSSNNLSGAIPKSLEGLRYLRYLNFSFNQLSGEIPSGGPFVNFTSRSFLENVALCGKPDFGVPPCKNQQKAHHLLKYILLAAASTMILIALLSIWIKYQKRNAGIPSSVEDRWTAIEHRMLSYQELRRATNEFCESNLLGVGSFGSVYKGTLSDGLIVAIKVLNQQMEAAFKSFDAECQVWRTIRHRNIVKVITTCSSPEVRVLVLHYMPNGSLEKWLYSHNYCLNLLQRISILVDIASALEYLHHGQSEPVVHCDLKPSNILLDEDMVAHVGDFGLAKILAKNKDETQTRTLGTLGYIAPEYGSAGKVSTKGDVFSYGIMMLEMISRRKPTDEMFVGELSLRQWMNLSIPDRVLEVVDFGLLSIEEGRNMNAIKDIILSIMEIGLRCSEEAADDRMEIKDVVPKLMKIKLALGNRNI